MKILKLFILGLLTILIVSPIFTVEAYVSVKGYYRSNGTYVAPHVRSNPNGLKYDNYGYTPSQGLYNKTYGTRGSEWDTPTYITDPDYYEGKSLYESGSSGTTYVPTVEKKAPKLKIPKNAEESYLGGDWYCKDGYKTKYDGYTKTGCEKIKVPKNASLSSLGSDWYCNDGYKTTYEGYTKVGCEQIKIPAHASLSSFGNDWYCEDGYKSKYDSNFTKVGCEKIKVPKNATLSSWSNDWYCDDGYKTKYNDDYTKIGCIKD